VDEAPHTQRGRAPIVGGRFRVQRPDGMPGALALTVTDARDAHGRTFPARLRRIVVDADTPRPVTIRLEAGGEVAGRVVDGNGDPIGGVLLTLTRKGQTSTPSVRTSASAWSDESGRYRFVGLDPGPHQIAVSPGTVYIHRQPLEVETGDTDVVFELKRWRSIRGVVLGLDGKPLKGCVVALGLVPQTYARPHRGAVSTDDKGRFTLWRVMEGKPVHVTASPPRGSEGPAVPGTTRDVRPGAHDVVVRLRRGVTIEGHVRGIEGEPIPDCAVTTTNVRTSDGERSNWYHRPKTTTDENGRFVLGTFLPDLLADLSFVVPRSSKRRYFPETRKGIASGSRKLDVAMEHGVVIRGEVQGVDVSLLKGLRLTATPALTEMRQVSARTTLDGTTVRFEIGPLKPGPHLVKPSLRRSGQLFLPREVRAEAPSSNVVITVERAWYVSGRVIAKNPRGYRVRFHPPEGRGLDTTIRSTDGTFRLGRVRDHPGQLFVSLNGSKLVGLLENVLPSKGPFEVELAEGRTISGRITDLVGKVSRGKIIARRGQVTLSAGIAEDGWFETAPLPPGAWTLEVQASRPSGGTYLAPAEVQAGARNVLIRYIPSR
nr:carboxypeptidase regulatory-like domain-containing protein [Planctomycetota bacterium]